MRASTTLLLSWLTSTAWAGGYQSCVERVLVLQAYELDQLNPESERKWGYKCAGTYDKGSGKCSGSWVPCQPKSGSGKCNFDDLMAQMNDGGKYITFTDTKKIKELKDGGDTTIKKGDGADVRDSSGRIDMKKAALRCYHIYTQNGKKTVKSFPTWTTMKDPPSKGEYNAWINGLADWITEQNGKHGGTDKWRFDEMKSTVEHLGQARKGDHGSNVYGKKKKNSDPAPADYLLEAAQKALGLENVISKDLGAIPYDTSKRWKSPDWAATIEELRFNGEEKPEDRVNQFKRAHYGPNGDKAAREHWEVMQSFKQVKAVLRSCT